ncbi:hypothetical protein BDV33DRAFT_185537, partial [Aspergillus novoparasiticus]
LKGRETGVYNSTPTACGIKVLGLPCQMWLFFLILHYGIGLGPRSTIPRRLPFLAK